MRKPRDLHRYADFSVAAAQLRKLADDMERRATPGLKMKWVVKLSWYDPRPPRPGEEYRLAGATMSSKP